jgi:hypothetical protein
MTISYVPDDLPAADEAELLASGWTPSPTVPGWWRDTTASDQDYPGPRALHLARRDRARRETR